MSDGKIKLSDYFKLSNIRNFIEGSWNKFKSHSNFLKLEEHLREQALYRAVLCKECYKEGQCVVCGCRTPDMFYAPKKECPSKEWGEMLSKEEWDKKKGQESIDEDAFKGFNFEELMKDDLDGLPDWVKRRMLEQEAKKLRDAELEAKRAEVIIKEGDKR
jgi:hypothetical protein